MKLDFLTKLFKRNKEKTPVSPTKKALIVSASCTVLCAFLLFSTSIAWFTATKESNVNEIYSGNLDIKFYYSKTLPTEDSGWVEVNNYTDDIFKITTNENGTEQKNMLFEPGAVNVVYFKVKNDGNINARYDFTLAIENEEIEGTNIKGEKFLLSKHIKSAVVEVTKSYAAGDEGRNLAIKDAEASANANNLTDVRTLFDINNGVPMYHGELAGVPDAPVTDAEDKTEKIFALVTYMPTDPETAEKTNYKKGYKPKLLLKVKLTAMQNTVEYDSFGSNYDEYAVVPDIIIDANGFKNAFNENTKTIKDGDVVAISSEVTLKDKLTVNKNVTIIGNKTATIKNQPVYIGTQNDVTFVNMNFDEATSANNSSAVYAQGFKGKLVFDGCTFGKNNWEAVQITPVGDCEIVFKNCTFNGYAGMKRFIHIQPAINNTIKLKVSVTGCTFNNCDKVNYNTTADNAKGTVIDFDYFANGSTITMGENRFNLSNGVASYQLNPYFCDASGNNELCGNALLGHLEGDIKTYEVTNDELTVKNN